MSAVWKSWKLCRTHKAHGTTHQVPLRCVSAIVVSSVSSRVRGCAEAILSTHRLESKVVALLLAGVVAHHHQAQVLQGGTALGDHAATAIEQAGNVFGDRVAHVLLLVAHEIVCVCVAAQQRDRGRVWVIGVLQDRRKLLASHDRLVEEAATQVGAAAAQPIVIAKLAAVPEPRGLYAAVPPVTGELPSPVGSAS
eukprot:3508675-Prymnesium_polylepis.1